MRSATEVADAVRAREVSAREMAEDVLSRIEDRNPRLNAFVVVDADAALRHADAVDRALAAGDDPGPLAGVPIGVKDLEDCAGMPTSQGSLVYKGSPPAAQDSVHVARLRAAGAVPVGKTAAPEFGSVAFTASRAWGVTRNPWSPERTPGGSSGGSGAAVAGGLVPASTASDGGGSTRIPASFCGLVGHKPSYGRVPIPHLDQSQTAVPGVLVTTVADAAAHLDVASGPHDRDRASLPPAGISYREAAESLDLSGLRIAWSADLGFAAVDPDVAAIAEEAARSLASEAGVWLTASPVVLSDPVRAWLTNGLVDLWLDIDEPTFAERADDLERWNRRSLELTGQARVPAVARALRRRWQLEDEVAAVFGEVDVLLTPTTAVTAFAAEGRPPRSIGGRDVGPEMAVPFTMVANLCWNPATSVPAGVHPDGMPVGLQIIGRRHADEVCLRLARLLERARPWPRLAPGWD